MSVLMILKMIAAAATALTGGLALSPRSVFGFTGLVAEGARGISEIRSIFGGLFIALGVAPFFLGMDAYKMLGWGYLAIAIVRIISIVIDRSYDRSNWISWRSRLYWGLS